jgi:hypothetical protein
MATLGRRSAIAILFLLGALAAAQDDHAKQKAIDQTRRVAKAIKECPEQLTGNWQDECKVHKLYSGPPTNVDWDVLPSKTVRSPFQGIIEFTLPSRFQDTDLAGQSKKSHEECVEKEARMEAMGAPALDELAKEGPKWREGHYRYEFDVGSDAPDIVKMLWVVKDKDDKTVTEAARSTGRECWVVAAKSVGSPKPEGTSPAPNP